MHNNDFNEALGRATVIHLQPDDVLVFSDAADIMADPANFDRLRGIVGERKFVVFNGPIELSRLRVLPGEYIAYEAPCEACAERSNGQAQPGEDR
jgi:hypothetical protein